MNLMKETYELEIVSKVRDDGLTRYPTFETRCIGLRDIDHVYDVMHSFDNISSNIPGSKVKLGRRIYFFCHNCHSFIGEKLIPLRLEPFRYMNYSPDSSVEIHQEFYRCSSCGYDTRFTVQDPIQTI